MPIKIFILLRPRGIKYKIGSSISVEIRLAVTLRWLAGGSHLDICFAYGISVSSFFSERGVLWKTLDAIDRRYDLHFPIDDHDALLELSNGFSYHSGGKLNGCVSAIDGLAVRTRCPYKSEVNNVKAYCHRKYPFALIVLAGCDVRGKFTFLTANHSGSTHDSIAWKQSSLHHEIENGKLDSKFFLIGDEAFTCTQQLLSPYPGRGIGKWKDAFNYWLSHSRQCIERAFGMLVKRFGIFWRAFSFHYERWPLVITVCAKLHNLCVDSNIELPPRWEGDFGEDDTIQAEMINHPDPDVPVRQRCTGTRRADITNRLEREGHSRPYSAVANSKE